MEEHISMVESDAKMPLLSIESDLGDDVDQLDRRGEFTFFYRNFIFLIEILKSLCVVSKKKKK